MSGVFIYNDQVRPDINQSHIIVMGMLIGAFLLVVVKCGYLFWRNRQKAEGKMDKWRGCGDERDPDFSYII